MYIGPMYSRELLKGTVAAIILQLLSDEEKMYGYEICQKVKELTEGKIVLKDGSLYPALQKMTADGILSFKEEYVGKRVRKYYFLTRKGQKEKSVYLDEVKDFLATMNKIILPQAKPL